jgi:hypothetical protein
VLNPPEPPSGGFGVYYDFGPSGLTFNKPVTISIPHDVNDCPNLAIYRVYWYDPNSGDWMPVGGISANHVEISPTLHAVTFETTHFTIFGVGASSAGGVHRHHGGCAMSPYSQGNAVEFLLPYVAYIIVLLSIGWADARRQKTRRNVNEH